MAREDLELGPCAVFFGTKGTEEDLGRTEGGVRVAFVTDVGDLASDQWGTQPEDGVFTGQGATVTVPLAEYTLKNLGIALNMTVVGNSLIEGKRLVGQKLSEIAKSLLLKEYVDGVISISSEDWMRFPVAAPVGNPEILFSKTDQRIIEIEFRCFPDTTSMLYYIGNESAS